MYIRFCIYISFAFSALTLLVGRQEGHPLLHKNPEDRRWGNPAWMQNSPMLRQKAECFFWYRPTPSMCWCAVKKLFTHSLTPTLVVPEQRPLNGGCCCCRYYVLILNNITDVEQQDWFNCKGHITWLSLAPSMSESKRWQVYEVHSIAICWLWSWNLFEFFVVIELFCKSIHIIHVPNNNCFVMSAKNARESACWQPYCCFVTVWLASTADINDNIHSFSLFIEIFICYFHCTRYSYFVLF